MSRGNSTHVPRDDHHAGHEIHNPLTCGNVINRPQDRRITTDRPGRIRHTTGARAARIADLLDTWQAATMWVQAALRQVARIERAVGVAKADTPLRNALDHDDTAVGGAR